MHVISKWLLMCTLLLFSIAQASAADDTVRSFHFGVLHPNGASFFGYSVETRMDRNLYWFYTFGLPTVAAIGISYYSNYEGNGVTGTLGTSLGSYIYGSIAYQVKLGNGNFLKLGAGVSNGFSYDASEHPVIAYEHRF